MTKLKAVFTKEAKFVDKATTEVIGPIDSWDNDALWDWPDWPKGPVGASQTGGKGTKNGRAPGEVGLNPFAYSFNTARSLLQQMRDPPPQGMGAPVYPKKYPVSDEAEISRNIKAMALYLGADLVGVAKLTPERITLGVIRKEQEYVSHNFTHFIAIVVALDSYRFRTRLCHPGFSRPVEAPSADAEDSKSRSDIEAICAHLASYIRGLGYNAESQGHGRRVMNGPFANWTGLGETGRNNLLITPEFGPGVRLGGILTDLPLAEDQPIDFGVQEFCEVCRRCVRACPSGALTDGPKQLVRGVLKWPANRKLCCDPGRTHGGEVRYSCVQCQVVCSYSQISQFVDYDEHEEGDKATLGQWTELWHERGWSEGFNPPPPQERR